MGRGLWERGNSQSNGTDRKRNATSTLYKQGSRTVSKSCLSSLCLLLPHWLPFLPRVIRNPQLLVGLRQCRKLPRHSRTPSSLRAPNVLPLSPSFRPLHLLQNRPFPGPDKMRVRKLWRLPFPQSWTLSTQNPKSSPKGPLQFLLYPLSPTLPPPQTSLSPPSPHLGPLGAGHLGPLSKPLNEMSPQLLSSGLDRKSVV